MNKSIRPQSHQRMVRERKCPDTQETNTGKKQSIWGAALQTTRSFFSEQQEVSLTVSCMPSKENALIREGMSTQQNGINLLTALCRQKKEAGEGQAAESGGRCRLGPLICIMPTTCLELFQDAT